MGRSSERWLSARVVRCVVVVVVVVMHCCHLDITSSQATWCTGFDLL